MIRQNRISPRQFRRMLFIETFGAAALSFPAAACRGGLHGFLPCVFYAGLLALTVLWFVCLAKKCEEACPEQIKQGYGFTLKKWAAYIYLFRYFINAVLLTAFFGQSIREIYMPDTSIFMILFPFVLLLWYTVQTTLQKRARFLELIFPWIFGILLLLVLLALFGIGEAAQIKTVPAAGADGSQAGFWESLWSSFGNLWPGALDDPFADSLKNAYLLLLCAAPAEFLLFLKPAAGENIWIGKPETEISRTGGGETGDPKTDEVKAGKPEKKKIHRSIFTAVGGSYLCSFLLTFLAVRTMGSTLTAGSRFPVVKMMQLIRLPGGFLERFDILPAVFWLLCITGVVSGYLYYGKTVFAGLRKNFAESSPENMPEKTSGSVPENMPEKTSGSMKKNMQKNLSEKSRKRSSLWPGAAIMAALLALSCAAVKYPAMWNAFLLYKIWIDLPLALLLPLTVFRRKIPRRFPRKKSRKKSLKTIGVFLLLLLLPLTGCRQLADIEEKSYILSLYVDTADEDGYDFWAARADLGKMQERDERIPCQVTHIQAQDLQEFEEKYMDTVPGEPEWNHIYTIFLGAGMAASEKQTFAFLKEWDDAWQKSPNVLLALCAAKPEELYQLESIPEGSAGQEVSLIAQQIKDSQTEDLCETPIDFLRAKYEGEKKLYLYRVRLRNGELVLGKGTEE